ncbi:hypothetical protein AQI95_06095 [Streptomyces yokosukanensis]|uniref:Uncharacterized protein n=1 Tax=Streptomyces yokosukanensis TaxID=67386 RepID=A0A101PDD5_9ACTN|nr:hypothetical protein AQI95_06095 [Streptomyces yokosukanensis]
MVTSAGMGGLLLYGLGAPAELMALEAAMLVTLGCLGIVTAVWKGRYIPRSPAEAWSFLPSARGPGLAWACL